MAYAAVISLKQTINEGIAISQQQTINRLLNSLHSPTVSSILEILDSSRVSPVRDILEFASNETTTLQRVLERLNDDGSNGKSSSERVMALEEQIRDCAQQLEDALEFHSSLGGDQLEDVWQEITSFAERVKRLEMEFIQELSKQDEDGDAAATDDDDQCFSSNNYVIDPHVELVGYSSKLFITVRDHMIRVMRPDDLSFTSIHGEVGGGRTTVAATLFQDLRHQNHQERSSFFDCSAWVTVGVGYELKEVVIRILAQVDNLAAGEYEWIEHDDEKIVCKQLNKALKNRRYMIVLDDVQDLQLFGHLTSSCPDQSNGSAVMLTTASKEIALLCDKSWNLDNPRRMFEETAWLCLHLFFFQNRSISAELEAAGRKIVENCRGLPISLVKVFLFLLETDNSLEHWSRIAADKLNPIFMVGDEISEIFEIQKSLQSYNGERRETVYEFASQWVSFSNLIEAIKMQLHPQRFFSKMQIVSLHGMAGIGKTTFARKVFKDVSIIRHFDHHVWLTLGPKYNSKEILIDILAHIYPSIDRRQMKGDAKLARDLCEQLSSKRCFIVLDDLWSKDPLCCLKDLFPDIKGKTLVTTRLVQVAKLGADDIDYEMHLLNKEESWYLLREKVFAGGLCPSEFEKPGRKIAENCDGLPLLIVTVAEQLLKVEITLEYWNNVATGKDKSVFKNAHHEITKALLPSYHILPQYLKTCFLYIGVFRDKNEIPISKFTNLLIAEGILESLFPQSLEDFITECLSDLVDRSLVMVQRKVSDSQIKTCRHHSVFWHLSNNVAEKNKFFHAMNNYDDCPVESIQGQRRLCIRNSVLLGIKDVYNAMESSSKARTLLCTGPPHQYPVSLPFGSRLLRILDALAIRLYEFPIEVVELVHLKHLGLTCNGKLPSSISKLGKLQNLIVFRHYITTRLSENTALLPGEIWHMNELKHLQVMGGVLPDPERGHALLNLSTLLDVSAQSCTEKVLRHIPSLKWLGLRIELAPCDMRNNPFSRLNHISRLGTLESLKCVVINPHHTRSEVVVPPAPVSMFPSSLKRLSLSGFGFPWEYMKFIGELENLEVLKLKRYAFRGSKWEVRFTDLHQFSNLKFLLLEDTDLVQWEVKGSTFLKLKRLSIKHCYKLREFPQVFPVCYMEKLEIVDSNPAVVSWVEEIRQVMPKCEVDISQSWIEE